MMIISLRSDADLDRVRRALIAKGLWIRPLVGGARPQLLVEPHSQDVPREAILAVEGVEAVSAAPSEHPRMDAQAGRPLLIGGVAVGAGAAPVFMAGPCSVESEDQILRAAARVSKAGARFLRGGAFKPRTSPYAFQGHGERALTWLRRAADAAGLLLVTEVMEPELAGRCAEVTDLLQIGSRNMYNYPLLRAAARTGRPVLLKRGMTATVEEWLSAGEYCLVHGAAGVVLCERGVRGFDPSTRNLLDLGAVALLGLVRRQPVVVDPSHALGRRDLIPALSRAALCAGAAGLLIETHDDPGAALSDGPQALLPDELAALLRDLDAAPAAPEREAP